MAEEGLMPAVVVVVAVVVAIVDADDFVKRLAMSWDLEGLLLHPLQVLE